MEFERRASLNWDQFDVIVGLLDEALRYEGMSYNTVIAPPVLELVTRISTVSKRSLRQLHSMAGLVSSNRGVKNRNMRQSESYLYPYSSSFLLKYNFNCTLLIASWLPLF